MRQEFFAPASPGRREILPGQTYSIQGDHLIIAYGKYIIHRVARYDHHAWTPSDQPDTIVLLGGAGNAAKISAETLPGFEFLTHFCVHLLSLNVEDTLFDNFVMSVFA